MAINYKFHHTRLFFEKHFTFFCFSIDFYPKISQDVHTAKRRQGSHNFYLIRHSSRDRRVLHSSTTSSHSSLSGRCCCIRLFVLCTQFSLQQREAQGIKSESKLRTTLLHRRSWMETHSPPLRPRDALTVEHRRGASCPGSKPHPVMTGWRCWRGSAEPTIPPGLWAQSLHREEDTELKHNPIL